MTATDPFPRDHAVDLTDPSGAGVSPPDDHDSVDLTDAPPAPAVESGTGPRPASSHGRLRRLWRGQPTDPVWVRPGLLALLLATFGLYLWGLSANRWGNDFYSAAVQAGSTSWKAFFFGSSDGGNVITVDKPPASLWPMALAVRLFGLNAWSIFVPQALMGQLTLSWVRRRLPRAGSG